MHARMQGLQPSVHHLGEAGDLGDVDDLEALPRQRRGGAAGRDESRRRAPQAPAPSSTSPVLSETEMSARAIGDLVHRHVADLRQARGIGARLTSFCGAAKRSRGRAERQRQDATVDARSSVAFERAATAPGTGERHENSMAWAFRIQGEAWVGADPVRPVPARQSKIFRRFRRGDRRGRRMC